MVVQERAWNFLFMVDGEGLNFYLYALRARSFTTSKFDTRTTGHVTTANTSKVRLKNNNDMVNCV